MNRKYIKAVLPCSCENYKKIIKMQYSYITLSIIYNSILNILLTCLYFYLLRTSTLGYKTPHIKPTALCPIILCQSIYLSACVGGCAQQSLVH